jgi:hypothetical protein
MYFQVNGTDRIVIKDNGNVGIGTVSPNLSAGAAGSTILTVSASTSARNAVLELNGTRTNSTDISGYVRFFNNGAATPLADIRAIRGSSDTVGDLAFTTSDTERMRITPTGRVMIGGSSGTLDPVWQGMSVHGVDGTDKVIIGYLASATNGAVIAAHISGLDNWANLNYVATTHIFRSENQTERMRITSGGYSNFTNDGTYRLISASNHSFRNTQSGTGIIDFNQTSANPYGLFVSFSGADPNNTTNWLFRGYSYSSGTDLYFIYSNGTTGGRSDIRLKKNIVDATPKLDDLMKLRVVNYEWKQSIDGTKELGLIAQEVEQIFPKLVDTKPCIKMRKVEQEDGSIIEEEYEDGESKILKHSVLPFMTLKGLQELTLLVKEQQSQIESLKAEIQTLKQ